MCYFAVNLVKHVMKVDDSLDVLAVHGCGGATGTLLTAILALPVFAGVGIGNALGTQFAVQLAGVATAGLWSAIATFALIKLTQAFVGLRVSEEEELAGLDQVAHGESAYKL